MNKHKIEIVNGSSIETLFLALFMPYLLLFRHFMKGNGKTNPLNEIMNRVFEKKRSNGICSWNVQKIWSVMIFLYSLMRLESSLCISCVVFRNWVSSLEAEWILLKLNFFSRSWVNSFKAELLLLKLSDFF